MKEKESAFIKVLVTNNLADIALIKSTLEGSGVRYFIQGENMKFIRPVNPAILMVAGEDGKKAVELLQALKLSIAPVVVGKRGEEPD